MGSFEQTQNTHQNKMPETRVPMTLRDQFLQDPFFKSAWEDMESFRGSFQRDSQSAKMIESSEKREERKEENKEENKMKMERRRSVEKKEESKSVQQINVENRSGSSTQSAENKNKTTSLVPMNLRESFFDDPFFKDNWLDIQQSQKDFFSKAEERFSQQMEMLKSSFDQDFGFSSIGSLNKEIDADLSRLSLREAEDLKVSDNKEKVELSLDTAGYKPDELKVTAGQGVVRIEGRHEERSQSGEVMVSRNMTRQSLLPSSADPALVTSNLSTDGVLLITIPKALKAVAQDRNVPITIK